MAVQGFYLLMLLTAMVSPVLASAAQQYRLLGSDLKGSWVESVGVFYVSPEQLVFIPGYSNFRGDWFTPWEGVAATFNDANTKDILPTGSMVYGEFVRQGQVQLRPPVRPQLALLVEDGRFAGVGYFQSQRSRFFKIMLDDPGSPLIAPDVIEQLRGEYQVVPADKVRDSFDILCTRNRAAEVKNLLARLDVKLGEKGLPLGAEIRP